MTISVTTTPVEMESILIVLPSTRGRCSAEDRPFGRGLDIFIGIVFRYLLSFVGIDSVTELWIDARKEVIRHSAQK